jgi:hypothetical protein
MLMDAQFCLAKTPIGARTARKPVVSGTVNHSLESGWSATAA